MERFFIINDTYSLRYPVTCNDIEPDYKLKLTSAAAYFQDTVASFMTTRYVAAFDLIKDDIIWVVSDITFQAGQSMAMWRNEVVSEITLSELSSFRAYFDYVLRSEDGTVYATGTGIWAPVSLTTGRPAAIMEFCEIRKPLGETPAVRHGKFRYMQDGELIMETSYPVTHSELDFNRHMCNRSYLEFALRGIPEDFKDTHSVKAYMIKFERQTYLGDVVSCRYFKSQDREDLYLVRLLNSKEEEVCMIEVEWCIASEACTDISEIVER